MAVGYDTVIVGSDPLNNISQSKNKVTVDVGKYLFNSISLTILVCKPLSIGLMGN